MNNILKVKLVTGEELLTKIMDIAEKENINEAIIHGIGHAGEVITSTFLMDEDRAQINNFCGEYEITSIDGNISTDKNGRRIHLHINIADRDGHLFGGHLQKAIINPLCELFIIYASN